MASCMVVSLHLLRVLLNFVAEACCQAEVGEQE